MNVSNLRSRLHFFAATSLGCLFSSPAAFAHHTMGGRLPTSFLEGFLSGLLHPVIGPDHLVAVLTVGFLSLRIAKGGWWIATFVGATLAGTALHLARMNVPAFEVLIAGTVIAFGAMALSAWTTRAPARLERWLPLAGAAGALHGYAYGESIVGAEDRPLLAYLLGFCVVQAALALGARQLMRWVGEREIVSAENVRRGWGSTASLAGVALLVVALLP